MNWIAFLSLAISAVLLLAILGTMREVVIWRGEVHALLSLVTGSAPARTGSKIPEELVPFMTSNAASSMSAHPWRLLLFLSDECPGCRTLASQLRKHIDRREILPGFVAAAVIRKPDALSRLLHASIPLVTDSDERLSQSCSIRLTPTIVAVDVETMRVADIAEGGDIRWILNHIRPPLVSTT